MKVKKEKFKVFIDGVDYQHEIGQTSDGNKVYSDIDSLKEHNRCWEGCGIVECELVFKKWVLEQNWKEMTKNTRIYSVKEIKDNKEVLLIEHAEKHLQWLEDKVSKQKHKVVELKANLKKKGKK